MRRHDNASRVRRVARLMGGLSLASRAGQEMVPARPQEAGAQPGGRRVVMQPAGEGRPALAVRPSARRGSAPPPSRSSFEGIAGLEPAPRQALGRAIAGSVPASPPALAKGHARLVPAAGARLAVASPTAVAESRQRSGSAPGPLPDNEAGLAPANQSGLVPAGAGAGARPHGLVPGGNGDDKPWEPVEDKLERLIAMLSGGGMPLRQLAGQIKALSFRVFILSAPSLPRRRRAQVARS